VPGDPQALQEQNVNGILTALRFYTHADKTTSKMLFNTMHLTDIFKFDTDLMYKNFVEFHLEGYERFNTQIVRNAIFLSNIQRVIRSKINEVFVKAHKIVERSHKIADYDVTEYNYVDPNSMSTPKDWSAY
jgi:hypothetical protein